MLMAAETSEVRGQRVRAGYLRVGHRHLLDCPRRFGGADSPRGVDEAAQHCRAVAMHDAGSDGGGRVR